MFRGQLVNAAPAVAGPARTVRQWRRRRRNSDWRRRRLTPVAFTCHGARCLSLAPSGQPTDSKSSAARSPGAWGRSAAPAALVVLSAWRAWAVSPTVSYRASPASPPQALLVPRRFRAREPSLRVASARSSVGETSPPDFQTLAVRIRRAWQGWLGLKRPVLPSGCPTATFTR